jgi:alkylation response protein AidB-like acyl-CoA dehydrogenase
MDLELSPEQQELRTLAASLLGERSAPDLARAFLSGSGDTGPLWRELAELGWYEVGLEAGDGFGTPGLCILADQIGRHAAPTLFVDTAVAARVGGSTRGTTSLALTDAPGSECFAARDGDGYRLTGRKIGVLHGAWADTFCVQAHLDGATAMFFVDAEASTVEPETGLDPTGRPAQLHLAETPAELATGDVARALQIGMVATAAEAGGAAAAALDLAVAYAGERQQFGRPIGAFQSVQHMLAEAYVLQQVSWSTVLYAAGSLDEELPGAAEAASIAKAWVSRAAREIVERSLQVLGGIGFTWEHDLHLFLRRVLACEQRFGDALAHEHELGAALAADVEQRFATTERS